MITLRSEQTSPSHDMPVLCMHDVLRFLNRASLYFQLLYCFCLKQAALQQVCRLITAVVSALSLSRPTKRMT